MNKKPFLITLETNIVEEIVSLLSSKIEEFKTISTHSICIDLSRVSVLSSPVIGQIARLIKTTQEKNGDVYIFAPHRTVEQTLKLVKLHLIAIVLKDHEEFKTVCNGEGLKKELKKNAPPEKPVRKSKVQKDKRSPDMPPDTFKKKSVKPCMVIAMGIVTMILVLFIIFSVFQHFTIKSLSQDLLKEKAIMLGQKDSLNRELQDCKQEYDLYIELESNKTILKN